MSGLIPGTASSLLVQGKVFSHTNLTGDGEPNLHPAVRDFFDHLPVEDREPFLGYCAESALVSDQLWGLDAGNPGAPLTLADAAPHFAGSAMVSKKVREHGDPEHGQSTAPCSACGKLLSELGIEFIGA
ncbi:hypothetical protein OEIGOIKO_05390 [Streptomyces chrestomyceticus JCM 4735]|uniref:YwqJ-like deaminase n=1 Tax=Streptomyces chrestomyceticus JCM 4735 TaxID=1306181 RepID=A0A7U9KZA7_9ACTN|nr:YwqJ-related putative deaminase [Streptomyces chrestomyceticus]GCD37591.1 hypothetical protein OEIGOIKO_05390 [Streptomyces chrestomyceticus JCM 4735]